MKSLVIKNGTVIDPGTKLIKKLDIEIVQGKITKLNPKITLKNNHEVIDAKGLVVVPGFVDLHVHLREPGFTHKETIKTGSLAAAKGGFTTICAMPNTEPTIDTVESLISLNRLINKDAIINILPIGAISKKRSGRKIAPLSSMHKNGIVALSDDGDHLDDESIMIEAMRKSKSMSIPISQHCEDHSLILNGHLHEGWVSDRLGIKGRPREAENNMVRRDIAIAEKFGGHLHIAHISTKESVKLVEKAKKSNLTITAEVTPHHLDLTHESIGISDIDTKIPKTLFNTNMKVNPPLREKEDIEACIQGLNNDTIDAIATDHAPHSSAEKNVVFEEAPPGISGLESAFSIGMRLVLKRKIKFEKLIDKMTYGPAKAWQLNKIKGMEGVGKIEIGHNADLALIDKSKKWVYSKEQIVSMGKNSPYIDNVFKGMVVMTLSKGKIIFNQRKPEF